MATKILQIVDKIIVTDDTLTKSGISADAKVVGDAIKELNDKVVVDAEFSDTSVNPVQNQVVYGAIGELRGWVGSRNVSDQIDEALEEPNSQIATLQEQVADLMYKEIAITSFTNDAGTKEIGSTVTSVKLDWKTSKTPTTLNVADKAGTSITTDTGLKTYTHSGLNITADTEYKLTVTDERNATKSATTYIKFVNGVYYGAIASGATINDAAILGLTRKLQSSKAITFTTTAGDGQYIVYALPNDYGTPAFNVGGFDGGFHLETSFEFTNASGHKELYNVYYSDNLALGATTVKVS